MMASYTYRNSLKWIQPLLCLFNPYYAITSDIADISYGDVSEEKGPAVINCQGS